MGYLAPLTRSEQKGSSAAHGGAAKEVGRPLQSPTRTTLGNQATQRAFAATRQSKLLQRETFTGAPGTTAKDKDRPLIEYAGPMTETKAPGGTIIPKTAGKEQNCAGDSCNIKQFINWPDLGIEIPGVPLPAGRQGDWSKAKNFVPAGCGRVNCSGISVYQTRCRGGDAKKKSSAELELITFLYRWPETFQVVDRVKGKTMAVTGTQSDFHMMGRDAVGLPAGWHSKMDQRERVADIRDPWQSLYDAYPHTKQKDREIVQLCFCCDQSAIKTK